MNKRFRWTALRSLAFRRLWIATVISGTWVAGRPRQRTSLDDEFFYGVAIFDLADVSWIHWERSLTYFEIAP